MQCYEVDMTKLDVIPGLPVHYPQRGRPYVQIGGDLEAPESGPTDFGIRVPLSDDLLLQCSNGARRIFSCVADRYPRPMMAADKGGRSGEVLMSIYVKEQERDSLRRPYLQVCGDPASAEILFHHDDMSGHESFASCFSAVVRMRFGSKIVMVCYRSEPTPGSGWLFGWLAKNRLVPACRGIVEVDETGRVSARYETVESVLMRGVEEFIPAGVGEPVPFRE